MCSMLKDLFDSCEYDPIISAPSRRAAPARSAAAGVSAAAAAPATRASPSAGSRSKTPTMMRRPAAALAATPTPLTAGPLTAAGRRKLKAKFESGEQSDDETHMKRHGHCPKRAKGHTCACSVCKSVDACPRCTFRHYADRWRAVATYRGPLGKDMCWLVERKRSWPGPWALGCALCANLVDHFKSDDVGLAQYFGSRRKTTKWARFEETGAKILSHVQQHADSQLHNGAVQFMLDPMSTVVGAPSASTPKQPFGRGVPQPEEYIRIWEQVRSATSNCHSMRTSGIEKYSHCASKGLGGPRQGNNDQRQMAYVIAEVIRQDDRAFLSQCSDCSLCIDAGASKNVISFMAASATAEVIQTRMGLIGIVDESVVPSAAPGVSAGAAATLGVSAGAAAGVADSVDMVREMKSTRSKGEIMACLREFHSIGCRDRNKHRGIFNLSSFNHHRSIIRLCTFDGASEAQLTGRKLAADGLPNVRCVARDRAHAVRTNLRAPLRSDKELNRIRKELLDKKESLSKLVQYHPRARKVHMTCQQAVINEDGEQGGGLKTVLKNFSFANQRFESENTPARRIACTLMASMLFLTTEADDANRSKKERDNAMEILTVFNAEDLVLFGLEADLAGHGTEFLRFFDVAAPDPSLLPRRVRQFRKEVGVLFMEGKILHASNQETVTGIILRTLAGRKASFFWKDQVRTIGGGVANLAAVRFALKRVQTMARLLLETLDLEFNDALFPQAWEIFDLHTWQGVTPDSPTDRKLVAKFSSICRHRLWNEIAMGREFKIVRKIALAKFSSFPERERDTDGASGTPNEPGGVSAPGSEPCGVSALGSEPGGASKGPGRGLNRRCWEHAMDQAQLAHGPLPNFRTPQHIMCVCVSPAPGLRTPGPGPRASGPGLRGHARKLYAWYMSWSDSTCDVERLIGVVKTHMKAKHADVGTWHLRDCVTISKYGPKSVKELATREVVNGVVRLRPTEFLRRCNTVWTSTYGRRHDVSSAPRADIGKEHKTTRTGTEAGLTARVAKRRHALLNVGAGQTETVLPGMSMTSLAAGGLEGRNERQQQIARHARAKLNRLRHLPIGAAGVSAAAPAAKAKAKAKSKAKAKAKAAPKGKAAARPADTVFYAHGLTEQPPLSAGRRWSDRVMESDVIVVRDLAVVQKARDSYIRMDRPLLAAMLFGKRVATPLYCASASPVGGSSVQFLPALRKKFGVFLTANFRARHGATVDMFRRAARTLGDKCSTQELDSEDNAREYDSGTMVIDSLDDFSTFVRKQVSVARERSDRGTYRSRRE